MSFAGRWLGRLIRRRPEAPRHFPTQGFKVLGHGEKLAEQNWDWYSVTDFYPVRIGQNFRSHYQVVGKLGYGAHSTVWLCRDLDARKYLTMKVCVRDSNSAQRELAAYEHLDKIKTTHSGSKLVRRLVESFKEQTSHREHLCLLHEPLAISLATLQGLMPALNFLHTEAGMVHTDLQARNIHLSMDDDSILCAFEEGEMNDPSPRKVYEHHSIYASRGLRLPEQIGLPVLCDLGDARYGQETYKEDIQPFAYRAPEVILEVPWTTSADIWNLGVLTWYLMEGRQFFDACDPAGDESTEHRLVEMVSLLGPPPPGFLSRSVTSEPWDYFRADATWKAMHRFQSALWNPWKRAWMEITRVYFWTSSDRCCNGTHTKGRWRNSSSSTPG